jgi:hypothetical protein
MSPHDTLVRAFRALTKRQRDNLAWHVEKRTRICCGYDAYLYTRKDGAG